MSYFINQLNLKIFILFFFFNIFSLFNHLERVLKEYDRFVRGNSVSSYRMTYQGNGKSNWVEVTQLDLILHQSAIYKHIWVWVWAWVWARFCVYLNKWIDFCNVDVYTLFVEEIIFEVWFILVETTNTTYTWRKDVHVLNWSCWIVVSLTSVSDEWMSIDLCIFISTFQRFNVSISMPCKFRMS